MVFLADVVPAVVRTDAVVRERERERERTDRQTDRQIDRQRMHANTETYMSICIFRHDFRGRACWRDRWSLEIVRNVRRGFRLVKRGLQKISDSYLYFGLLDYVRHRVPECLWPPPVMCFKMIGLKEIAKIRLLTR